MLCETVAVSADDDPAATSGEANGESNGRAGIQSVDRALQVLEVLARTGRAGVGEVAAELGVHKSTASRLLAALELRGMVEQSGARGGFQIGVTVLHLASSVSARLSLVQQARSTLERLADDLGETVNLAVCRSGYAVNVDQAMGPSPLATHDWIGNLTPLHATASGKVFLAALTRAERGAVLRRRSLRRFTDATLTDRDELEQQLAVVTETGLAHTRSELEEGLAAAAVGVRDFRGEVVGSISVSGPELRFDPEDADLGRALLAAGAEVSTRMGHQPPTR